MKPNFSLRSRERERSSKPQMSTPSIVTDPVSGRASPPIIDSRVLLPLPEWPTMETNCPSGIVRSRVWTACTGALETV